MSDNPFIAALTGPSWLSVGEDSTVTYHFANDYGRAWTEAEKDAFRSVFASYEAICNVTFTEVATAAEADLIENLVTQDQMNSAPTEIAGVWSGWQEEPSAAKSNGYFVYENDFWSSLDVGSKAHWMITHEIGHGLGLEHPHSTWHGTPLFPGVSENVSSDPGDNGLNTVLTTAMSYRLMDSPSVDYGQIGGPMAFDIAALQEMYGARAHATGADTYRLPTANGAGTFWTCIWDTGGTDTILQGGSIAAKIDLRPATLLNEMGGGGWWSNGKDIKGGFTIANGVTIENAIGGNGNDTIIGNDADNFIWGRKGRDTMTGGDGADLFDFRAADETGATSTTWDRIQDFSQAEGDKIDLHHIDASAALAGDNSFVWKGTGAITTSAHGELRYAHSNGHTLIYGDTDGDTTAEFVIDLMGVYTLNINDFIL